MCGGNAAFCQITLITLLVIINGERIVVTFNIKQLCWGILTVNIL